MNGMRFLYFNNIPTIRKAYSAGLKAADSEDTERKRLKTPHENTKTPVTPGGFQTGQQRSKRNGEITEIGSRLLAAQEEERETIGRELHDNIGQMLAALKYSIEGVLAAREHGDTEGAFKLLEQFVPRLQFAIQETRSLYMHLRPGMIEELGLLATMRWLCREFETFHCNFHIEFITAIEEREIPEHLKIVIFRIAQEALSGLVCRAMVARVCLSRKETRLELTISCNGYDPNPSETDPETICLRLTGMRERALVTGGTFSVEQHEKKGRIVRISWPVD